MSAAGFSKNSVDSKFKICDFAFDEVRLVERLDAFLFQAMQNTPTELYRDAIGMIAADKLPHSAIKQANLLAETGEAFNAAVWAAIRLQEMVNNYGEQNAKTS